MLSKDEIRARIDLVQLIGKTVALKKDGANFTGLCPFHDDHSPSLVVYPETRRWHCFGCNKSGDCFEWTMQTTHVDFPTALAQLREQCGDTSTERSTTTTTTWNITDVDGNVLAQHVRLDYSDGTKSYTWPVGTKPAELPLYGLHVLFQKPTEMVKHIIIPEGEKATDALIKAGYAAVGTVTGACSCPNQEAFVPLIGFDAKMILWPDNDDIGRAHMDKVGQHLKTLGMVPYLITWTSAPSHGDAYDYIQQGLDVQVLLDAAALWVPTSGSPNVIPGGGEGNVLIRYRGERCKPPAIRERCKNVADSCCNGESETLQVQETLFQRVLDWVKSTSGWWSTQELDSDMDFRDVQSKDYRRSILYRLKEQGIIEGHPRANKQWRFVNKRITSLDFKASSRAGVLDVKWPLDIEGFVNLYEGNLVVVAGSPNSGKTALLLNLVHRNQDRYPIVYFSSEMGGNELQSRLELFPNTSIDSWNFTAYPRNRDFQDVVVPDLINIIDFLEVSEDFYGVNSQLTAINEKVGTGLAIVALQKKIGAQLGRGAEFSMEKPRLYLSMDEGKLRIIKGKAWANPKVNPNGLSVGFKITGGCQFEITKAWDWPKV